MATASPSQTTGLHSVRLHGFKLSYNVNLFLQLLSQIRSDIKLCIFRFLKLNVLIFSTQYYHDRHSHFLVSFNCPESNEGLKLKFRKLHSTVVNGVNPASIINFLFQEAFIGADDMRTLFRFREDPQQQCTELLALLHTSENQQAFVQLYLAIKQEPHLQWLIERIDNFTDQSATDLLQQQQQQQERYISEPAGEFAC